MKIDGRSYDHKALEEIRLIAVKRVRNGEPAARVIAEYGFNRTTIYKWLNAALRPGVGIKALRSTKATGRPRSLTPLQEKLLFRWTNGRNPRQSGFDFDLWTRAAISKLIERKFGIRLGVTTVRDLLAKLGLPPGRPLQRAFRRAPVTTERWQRDTYPAIAKQAKLQGADVLFWDEYSFQDDTVDADAKTIRGKTSSVEWRERHQTIGAASAVTASGAFWRSTYQGTLNAELFVALLRQMMKYRNRPVHLVVSGSPVHMKACVKRFVTLTKGRLTIHVLPGNAEFRVSS